MCTNPPDPPIFVSASLSDMRSYFLPTSFLILIILFLHQTHTKRHGCSLLVYREWKSITRLPNGTYKHCTNWLAGKITPANEARQLLLRRKIAPRVYRHRLSQK
jgi:hypothetical protein